jgi:hypothetical protein
MKIAVLIVGEYRTFPACRRTMTFLDQDNVDVYVSTWDKTNTKNPQRIGSLGYREYTPVYEPVTKEQIQEAIGISCSIEIQDSAVIKHEKADWKKMIIGWLLGFNKIKQSSVKYDFVLLLRPDLFFDVNALIDIAKFKNPSNSIGATVPNDVTCIDDTCLFGTFENMSKVIDPLLISAPYENLGTIHHILSEYIRLEHGLDIVPLPITSGSVIGRYPTTMTESFQSVQKRFFIWFKDGKYDF